MKMFRALAGLLLFVGLAACGSDATGPKDSLIGTYTLKTVDGDNVPVVVTNGTTVMTVVGGSMRLNGDKTWSVLLTGTTPGSSTYITVTDDGIYSRSGDTLTLVSAEDGQSFSVSISRRKLTTIDSGMLLVYEK